MFDATFFKAKVWHKLILSFLLGQVNFVYQISAGGNQLA